MDNSSSLLPPINVTSKGQSLGRDEKSAQTRQGGESLSSSVSKHALVNKESTGVGGGVLKYLTPQKELFSHFESPQTHSRPLSPSFVCGKPKQPENIFVLSPRGDTKPETRPYSQAFVVPAALKYEDTFVLSPGNKPSEGRPHSSAFLGGTVKNPAKDDAFVLSPRNDKIEHPIVSNMRCGLHVEHADIYTQEPTGPVITTFRPHSPAFLSGVIQNPGKDDYFVLSPRDLSRLKDDKKPPGPPMLVGGSLHHEDAFMLEPSPHIAMMRDFSGAFLAGAAPPPHDEFVLSPTGDAKQDYRVTGMHVGGNPIYSDAFFDGGPYRNPVLMSDRPTGAMKTHKGRGQLDVAASGTPNPYQPAEESRRSGGFKVGVVKHDEEMMTFVPNDQPSERRRQSGGSAPRMSAGAVVDRAGDIVYTSGPQMSNDGATNASRSGGGMFVGGLSRGQDQFLFSSESLAPPVATDRKTPYFPHAKAQQKRSEVINSQPTVCKGGMRLPSTVSHKDDVFVITEGGPAVDKARQGSSLHTSGNVHTNDSMEKYEGPGPAPVPSGSNEVRGMRVSLAFPHDRDDFVLTGGGAVVDRGRQGGLRTGGRPVTDDSMEKYESQGAVAVSPVKAPGKGMKVSSAHAQNITLSCMSPSDNTPKYAKNTSGMCTGGKWKTDDTMQKYESQTLSAPINKPTSEPAGFIVSKTVPHTTDVFVITEGGPAVDKARQGSSLHTSGNVHTNDSMEKYEGPGPAPVPSGSNEVRGMRVSLAFPHDRDDFVLTGGGAVVDRGRQGGLRTGGRPVTDDSMEKYESQGAVAVSPVKAPGKGMKVSGSSSQSADIFALSPDVKIPTTAVVPRDAKKQSPAHQVSVSKPSMWSKPSKLYTSPYCQTSSSKPLLPENDMLHDDIKTYGHLQRDDEYFNQYEEVSSSDKKLRPHSVAFTAGALNREKDVQFLEPTLCPITQVQREFSQPLHTFGQHHEDLFVIKHDENSAISRSMGRPYSSPCTVTTTIKHDDQFLLEPNKLGHNVTRATSEAFKAGAVPAYNDIYASAYEAPVKEPAAGCHFSVRRPDDTRDDRLNYDLEYYDPVVRQGPSELTVFNTHGPVGRSDEYITQYDEVFRAQKELRPHSVSFKAGELNREKDVLFLEPMMCPVTEIQREFSQPLSTFGQHHDDVYVLRFDEKAMKAALSQRPHSSPYIVSSSFKHDDHFLLEPNKQLKNITRSCYSAASASASAKTPVFVAGSKRLVREDWYVREAHREKPSLCRPHSSQFITSRPKPSDIFYTEPIEKPQLRPVLARPRSSVSDEERALPTAKETKIMEMLAHIAAGAGGRGDAEQKVELSAGDSSAGGLESSSSPHSSPAARGDSQETNHATEGVLCPETTPGNDAEDDEVRSTNSLDNIRMLIEQQRRDWEKQPACFTIHVPEDPHSYFHKRPSKKPSKTSKNRPSKLNANKQQNGKTLAGQSSDICKNENADQELVGQVTNLLNNILQR